MLPDFLGHREDLGPKLVGILDLDPLALGQDDHAVRRPHAEFLFDEQAIRPDLETVPRINPPSRRLPFLGNQKFARVLRCGRAVR